MARSAIWVATILVAVSGSQLALAVPVTEFVKAGALCNGSCVPLVSAGDDDVAQGDGVAQVQIGQVTDPLGILAASSVGFDGSSFTPTISTYAFGAPAIAGSVAVLSNGWGFQRYTLTGDLGNPVDLTIDATLTYTLGGPAASLLAGLFAFRMVGDVFDTEACSLLTLSPACFALNGAIDPNTGQPITVDGLYDLQNSGFAATTPITDGIGNMSLTISGLAGNSYFMGGYVGTALLSPDSFVDSRSTFRIAFDDPSLVTAAFTRQTFVSAPAPTPVPEPATWALLTAALGALALRRRST